MVFCVSCKKRKRSNVGEKCLSCSRDGNLYNIKGTYPAYIIGAHNSLIQRRLFDAAKEYRKKHDILFT